MLLNKISLIILLILCFCKISFCQSQDKVYPENALKADEYRKKYKNEGIVYLDSKDVITFFISTRKEKKTVSAKCKTINDALIIKDNYSFEEALFYDEESEIGPMNCYNDLARKKIIPTCGDYQDDDIFYTDEKVCIYKEQFGTRGMRPRFEYYKTYKDAKYLAKIFFNDTHPIINKEIKIIVPNWLDIELREFNFETYSIEKTINTSKDKRSKEYTFRVNNILSLKSENNSPGECKVYPHIVIVYKKFTDEQITYKLFEATADLYAWYKNLSDQIGNNTETIAPFVEKLIEGQKTDIEKVEAIYYWIHNNIRYIAFENGIMGFKPDNAQNVFKKKYGDCKGMANLLKQMLILAGFDARLTWIGTSDLPYDYTLPSFVVDNHMICTLFLNGKRYFLDGTETFIAFNDYANRIQGKQVMIEDGDKYLIDTIPSFSKERNIQENIARLSLEGNILKVDAKKIFNGEDKTNLLWAYASVKTDDKNVALQQYIISKNKNIKLLNFSTPDFNNRQIPLVFDYQFELSNNVTMVGNEIYVIIDFEKEFQKLEFDSTRINDYEFNNKILICSKSELIIPDGYKVDYTPTSLKKVHKDFTFDLKYTIEGDKIYYFKTISIDNAIIRKSDFKTWNANMTEIKKFYNESIVLIKN